MMDDLNGEVFPVSSPSGESWGLYSATPATLGELKTLRSCINRAKDFFQCEEIHIFFLVQPDVSQYIKEAWVTVLMDGGEILPFEKSCIVVLSDVS